MFPIHSMSGRVLGFGGRILTNNKKAAKYLNSPESDIYHKSNILYGIYYAKKSIAKEDNCYLVEGYTDMISLYQSGIENVVSSSGTALSENQIRLINRLTKNITILFDGDAAGIRASIRGIDLILEQGMSVRVLMFPDSDDPDSFAKKVTPSVLKEYLKNNTQDFINFKVSLLMDEVQNDPVKKAGLIRDIVISISKIPDRIQREVYIQECSRTMDISENVLFDELAQLDKKERREASKKPRFQKPATPVLQKTSQFEKIDELKKYEKEIIKILLLYGNNKVEFEDYVADNETDDNEIQSLKKVHFNNVVSKEIYLNLQEDEVEFTDELFQQIYYEIINQLNQQETILVDTFVNHSNVKIANLVTNILMDDEKHNINQWDKKGIFVKSKESDISKMVFDAIFNLRRILIKQKISSLKFIDFVDEDERRQNFEDLVNYTNLKMRLSERLKRVV